MELSPSLKYTIRSVLPILQTPQEQFDYLGLIMQFCEEQRQLILAKAQTPMAEVVEDVEVQPGEDVASTAAAPEEAIG